MNDVVAAFEDVRLFRKIAKDCQQIARHFANRQNSDSTLTARECTGLVTTMLNAGNLLAEAADRTDPPLIQKEDKSCPLISNPQTLQTPPSSPPSASSLPPG